MGRLVGAYRQRQLLGSGSELDPLRTAVVEEDEACVGVLGDDVEESRPREPKGPQHEIELPGPEPRRKPVDILLRARLEGAQRWATWEQVDYFRLELVLALGFEEPLHERPPTRFVAAAEAAWIPHTDQGDASRLPEPALHRSRTNWRRAIAAAATASAAASTIADSLRALVGRVR